MTAIRWMKSNERTQGRCEVATERLRKTLQVMLDYVEAPITEIL